MRISLTLFTTSQFHFRKDDSRHMPEAIYVDMPINFIFHRHDASKCFAIGERPLSHFDTAAAASPRY